MLKILVLLALSLTAHAGLTTPEVEFNVLLQDLTDLFASETQLSGKRLVMESEWAMPMHNAYTSNQEHLLHIQVMGGLVRDPRLTPDALVIVLCHELGHVFGGRPERMGSEGMLSLEGQADYFATHTCFRRYAAFRPSRLENVPVRIQQTCANSFSTTDESAICERTLVALTVTAKYLDERQSSLHPSDIFTPSADVVGSTLLGYPSAQCRVDTYMRGALLQERPACWYKDKD